MAAAAITDSQDIAVVGMAGRFPGARNVGEFWRNLCAGVESVSRFSDAELRNAGEDPALLREPNYVRAGAPLDDVEHFDAGFFGFSAREAAILDPQHRHFLEVCWEALEDAGHVPASFAGAIGVFAGAGMQDYYVHHLAPNRRLMQEVGAFLVRHTGNDKDFLTTRVSYCFDLRGPSVAVQTACSTSLVAIHMAAQSLLNRECDLALAGGVSIQLPHRLGYLYLDGEILSPDGHCRAFDADARGTIFGSGAGVVVLRRAADALAARDHVYALLRGSAVNNDGRGKVSYLAPSLDGQARCVAEALAIAGVPASSVGYVEAHGTGTPVGDPIEIAALTQAYGVAAGHRCAVGSVKTNIGHLDTAAGVASFIKAVLALEHRQIPPSLNFSAPNPACAFDQSPFHVNGTLTPWAPGDAPRRAAVNSLGVGGTNAHVVLEEAPPVPAAVGSTATSQLLCLSARSPAALERSTERLAAFLRANPERALGDVAYTLQVGRRAFACRRTVVAAGIDDAVRQLEASRGTTVSAAPETAPPVVFMFPGGGAQYPNMGRELYASEPVFREHFDRVLAIVSAGHGLNLIESLFPAPGDEARAATMLEGASRSLLATFAVEYAMAQLWRSRGIEPAALVGHSLGELTAACVAGRDVVVRHRRRRRRPRARPRWPSLGRHGRRRPVGTGAGGVPDSRVVGGSRQRAARCASSRDRCPPWRPSNRRWPSAASTCAGSDCRSPRTRRCSTGTSTPFAEAVGGVRLQPPDRPLLSNVTGDWAVAGQITTADYWVRQLRQPVRFSDGLSRVLDELPGCVLLEVGPGTTLTSLALQQRGKVPARRAVASMRHPEDATSDHDVLLGAVGRLWSAGVSVDWTRHRPDDSGRRVSAADLSVRASATLDRPAVADGDGRTGGARRPTKRRRGCRRSTTGSPCRPGGRPVLQPPAAPRTTWLVFDAGDPLHDAIRHGLSSRGDEVVRVSRGTSYEARPDGSFVIRPGERDDYDRLLADLAARAVRPRRVAHLWGLGAAESRSEGIEVAADLSFYSLLFLAQAWDERHPSEPLHLAVVSSGMQSVGTEPLTDPARALALGPCLVIPREYPALSCSSIDWAPGDGASSLDPLVTELRADVRGGRRRAARSVPVGPGAGAAPAASAGIGCHRRPEAARGLPRYRRLRRPGTRRRRAPGAHGRGATRAHRTERAARSRRLAAPAPRAHASLGAHPQDRRDRAARRRGARDPGRCERRRPDGRRRCRGDCPLRRCRRDLPRRWRPRRRAGGSQDARVGRHGSCGRRCTARSCSIRSSNAADLTSPCSSRRSARWWRCPVRSTTRRPMRS